MDKTACENLIEGILKEKKKEDNTKNIRKLERIIHRNKTADRHNQSLERLSSLGIKVYDSKTRQKMNATT